MVAATAGTASADPPPNPTYVQAVQQAYDIVNLAAASDPRPAAEALKILTVRYDNLWRMPFPYVMTLHHAPTDGGDYRGFHFHIEFHPPLRKPNLLKYLAGPEIGGGNFLSDTSPEDKAAELRSMSDIHYKSEARS